MSVQNEADSSVRVTVTPAQSSYFAGEPLSVTITFTNTRSPEAAAQAPRSLSHTHKRGAHSISSAPLSKPPTSPGLPRQPASPTTPKPTRRNSVTPLPVRKGLVGQNQTSNGDSLPELLAQRRKKLLAKSLSVSIAPTEIEDELADLPKSASHAIQTFQPSLSSSSYPMVSSPLARSETLPLSSDHPHARKDSLLDGTISLESIVSPTSTTSTSLFSPSSSSSTLSLALDSISEAQHNGHRIPVADSVYAYGPPKRRGTGLIGLGQPSDPTRLAPPRTALSSQFPNPNSELILYSYVQLAGTFVITPGPSSTEQTQRLGHIRSSLRRTSVGSGSMDITSSLHQRPVHTRKHSRASSISFGLLSLLSSSPTVSPSPSAQSLVSSPSIASRLGFGANEETDPDAPLPTVQIPPVMLGVDLVLMPGESRTYQYSVPLPSNLPPTFKGRVLQFSYEIIVGTCRAGTNNANSISRVMKVPVRIYNNVVVGRPPSPYDLMWPAKARKEPPIAGTIVEESRLKTKSKSMPGTLDEVKSYAQRLVSSLPDPTTNGVRIKVPAEMVEWRRRRPSHGEDGGERDGLEGCREAVEVLTRNHKKASYDVTKDGVKVAVLTFTKSAYRLGETVLGIVEINERHSRSRVLQVSALLETHEVLPSSIAPTSTRQVKRVHAEHHSSFTLGTLRTTFTLDIPSDSSPAFQISVGNDKPGGLEWKVRLCLLVAVAAESASDGTEGVRMKGMVRDGPPGEWGASWWATPTIAPMEKPTVTSPGAAQPGWTAWLLGYGAENPEEGIVDGIKPDMNGGVGTGVDFGGGEEGWKDVKVETVECEVPVKVWPGNTAFKAAEVVFDV
ncbi:Rgp1-domain-containing protein [Cylindrobasidium torrendii FP15055 ss-10]|uniref:Rgp1-domain-containing protein n=1 Tax=Cylindrobasidium torrendii FP15055 ss-10 TaxID=1314674 RepID=A0A0D7BCN3_9AGAR|nr:Rgp1-domain-containing protein [Cylindrobasidium torrendii FP15055 ss-10]